jgi:hypothetical protein
MQLLQYIVRKQVYLGIRTEVVGMTYCVWTSQEYDKKYFGTSVSSRTEVFFIKPAKSKKKLPKQVYNSHKL